MIKLNIELQRVGHSWSEAKKGALEMSLKSKVAQYMDYGLKGGI